MHYDVIIIGGSFAGLSAALYLARSRRSVCVIDAGLPRNRFASVSHGVLGQDGVDPQVMLATARAQVAAYPTVSFVQGQVHTAQQGENGFSVTLDGGETLTSSKLVLAYGISDILPGISGVAERWGKSIIHCPYCHGYEFSDQRLGVLNTTPMSQHQTILIAEWGPTTYFLNGAEAPDTETVEELHRRGITIEPGPIKAIIGDDIHCADIQFEDGYIQEIDALFISPSNRFNTNIAEQLGCAIIDQPLGKVIEVDQMKMTTIEDVYAVGDIIRGAHNVTFSLGDGVMAAMAIHRSFVFVAL